MQNQSNTQMSLLWFVNNNTELQEFQRTYNSAYYQSLADTYQQNTCVCNFNFSIT